MMFRLHAASWVQIWLHGKQEKLLLTNRDSCDKTMRTPKNGVFAELKVSKR